MAIVLALSMTGCRQEMYDQPRYEPLEESEFFPDGQSARLPVEGTVARAAAAPGDPRLLTGKADGRLAAEFPIPATPALLSRGRERYDIFCSPCHDRVGDGNGMVVQRGYRAPPSFHSDRLRAAPVGHFFDVVTNGFGAMPDYAAQVPPEDRWAIVAYIRALQLSQNAAPSDLSPEDRARLISGESAAPAGPKDESH